jgi:hypothetical protein
LNFSSTRLYLMQSAALIQLFPKKKLMLITSKRLMMIIHLKSKGLCVVTAAQKQTCGCFGL